MAGVAVVARPAAMAAMVVEPVAPKASAMP